MAPRIIGLAGGTGSGKTTVARRMVDLLPDGQALLIQHDAYYRDRSHLDPEARAAINFDEPDALDNELLVAHLARLRAGLAIECPRYDFATHTRRAESRHVSPRPIVIVEGILVFAVPALREMFDLRIFVDTPDDLRLMRRMKRDLLERGRDLPAVEAQYLGTVRPMHELHVGPTRRHAHLIITDGGENGPGIEAIVGCLLHGLRSGAGGG